MLRLLLLGCLLIAGCATTQPVASPDPLFDDGAFGAPSVRIDPTSVLAASPAMRQYLKDHIAPQLRLTNANQSLLDALYTRGQLKLTYDTELTRTAAEAFDARAGNCLSLVLMTAAFARELDLAVRFQSVPSETWGREGDLWLSVGHVNISIGRRPHVMWLGDGNDWLTVDFLPSADLRRQRAKPIEEARVVAMYLNNKAAEAIAGGQLDDAYAWARAGIVHDPGFAATYNTLGVVYLRHRQPARAEAALRRNLALDPDNTAALANLVQALEHQGRADEAHALAQRLQRIEVSSPVAAFERGEQAMRDADYALARRQFEQAIRRGGDFHEFHFALAQALVKLGEFAGALHELERAQNVSATPRLQTMYAAKLQRLRERLVQ
jgi:tetratricopeptide (TPR) repeat protein